MSDMDEFYRQIDYAAHGEQNTAGGLNPMRTPTVAAAEQPSEWAKTVAAAACWAQTGNSYFPVSDVVRSIPPGAYRCKMSQQGPYLEKMKIEIDALLHLPDSTTEKLLTEFAHFWKLKASFDKRGFTFKRGMLMWGPPGSGKTSAVWQMTQVLVKGHKGVVVFVEEPTLATWCLAALRRIEPDRKIVTVTEDIDAIIRQHGEHALLALLDGENQIENVVHVATTNYPHLLDRRFVDRPSRFDTIMKVGMPSALARETYFKAKEPTLKPEDLDRWVARTDGYSVAHLREVCIAIKCFGQSEESVFERMDAMKAPITLTEDGDDEASPVGFTHNFIKKRANGR